MSLNVSESKQASKGKGAEKRTRVATRICEALLLGEACGPFLSSPFVEGARSTLELVVTD